MNLNYISITDRFPARDTKEETIWLVHSVCIELSVFPIHGHVCRLLCFEGKYLCIMSIYWVTTRVNNGRNIWKFVINSWPVLVKILYKDWLSYINISGRYGTGWVENNIYSSGCCRCYFSFLSFPSIITLPLAKHKLVKSIH